jgi:hypothetical protein
MSRRTRSPNTFSAAMEFSRAAAKTASWRLFLGAQAIALSVALARCFEHRSVDVTQVGFLVDRLVTRQLHFPDAHFIVAPLAATFLLFAALAAKEGMRRGASLHSCLLLGVGAASIATAVVQWSVRALLGGDYAPSANPPLLAMAVVAVDVSMLGTLFTMAYLKHESERQILTEVRQTELRRVELDRHRLESGIKMSRTTVDPQWLSMEIEVIRDLYGVGQDPPADARLDALIEELRRRVSTGATSTLAKGLPA